MEIAILDSVTVSIAAETTGIFNLMSFVILLEISTSLGKTSETRGFKRTSSNVRNSLT